MKPAAPLTIYIASSFRSLHAVHLLRDVLRDHGHTVLDWSKLAPPLPKGMSPGKRRMVLDSDERGEIFAFCSQACASADLVIYLGQAGQDAGVEVGMAYASGVPVFGLGGPLEESGLMMARAVTRWCSDVEELLLAVEGMAERMEAEKFRAGAARDGGCGAGAFREEPKKGRPATKKEFIPRMDGGDVFEEWKGEL